MMEGGAKPRTLRWKKPRPSRRIIERRSVPSADGWPLHPSLRSPVMLEVLRRAEADLPRLLQEESRWTSLFIDYHPPTVERLWCAWGDYRLSLHRIHPCEAGAALFHTHLWPSAMRILS